MDPKELVVGLGIAFGALAIILLLFSFIRAFLVIGRPNELLVFSGRPYRLETGETVGFRLLRGGRSIRWPIIERVDRMDMTVMPVDIQIRAAYAKGNIPINVDAVANAKITSDPLAIHHATERFLGKDRAEIRQVAKETLEGTLRGVIAQLTPEEINHDRQKLSERLKAEVADDLGRMGLQVDTFKIQHIYDEVKYLDSIGRIRTAEVLRDAEISESDAAREAEQAIAGAESRGRIAQAQAESAVAEKHNDLKRILAELEAECRSEEERTAAAGREARAKAMQQLQKIRGSLETLRLEAEQVIPADRERAASELRAAGDAAIRAETGRAQAESLGALQVAWREAGDRAPEIFLLQQLESVLAEVARAARAVSVKSVNVIDSGDGRSLARHVGGYPAIVAEILDRIRDTVGVDVPALLTSNIVRQSRAKESDRG